MLRFLGILAIFGLLHAANIHISGKIECSKTLFSFLVAVKEFDWHFGNDRLYTSKPYDSLYPHHYSAYAEVNDVDEMDNDKYEIFVSFWHTCSRDDKWKYYENRVGYVKQQGEYYLQHNVNLTNAEGELSWRDWEDWVTSNGFRSF
ncbi:hypothetical protein L5515_007206 [Caenorhabditis briggsae]|uniref:Uncharacterized protein n=1 Tax=Caenorhabditis briggsae TaxID=6238 RepID=A0AAE9EXT4_CAEBR|nr:hypothetical protein L5515_007206 [Caenorhabditis briggsae]